MATDDTDLDHVAALRATGFRRELTPTWLHLACLLGGHRPPDLSGSFRYVYLGGRGGITPAVVAAVHPQADVWYWSDHSSDLEQASQLARSAQLDNLRVHEPAELPPDLGGPMADLIVVDEVLTSGSVERRDALIDAIGRSLRPGGLAGLVYKTTVAWAEIAPVQRVMRRVAQRHTGHPDELVPSVLDLLDKLRKGGARHLTARPRVAAWLDDLMTSDPATIRRAYLEGELRPVSHAQIAGDLEDHDCRFVGSALLSFPYELSDELSELVAGAPSPRLREAYRDLAARPEERFDVFRRGAAELTEGQRSSGLDSVPLVRLDDNDQPGRDAGGHQWIADSVHAGALHPVSVAPGDSGAVTARGDALARALTGFGLQLETRADLGTALAPLAS